MNQAVIFDVDEYQNPAQQYEAYLLSGKKLTFENPAEKPVFDNIPDKQSAASEAGSLARQSQTLAAAQFDKETKKQALKALCDFAGVDYPVSRWGFGPEVKRLCDSAWWARKLHTKSKREWEAKRIADGVVNERGQLYCSDQAVIQWRGMRARNAEFLQGMFVFNDDAFMASLADIAKRSLANPEVRRAEMMARLRGMEDYALEMGHGATFLTITCPSKYHANSGKYQGFTPKQAQAYLCDTWALVRSALQRAELDFYGFRVAEPHNDGCPHWHMIVFAPKENIHKINTIYRAYSLAEDGTETGAAKRRFTSKWIQLAKGGKDYKGGAAAYIAKYISKNIDGKKQDGSTIGAAIDRDGNTVSFDAIVTAERVLAWASMWGIRQFQQFGGERVGPYRELRRLQSVIVGSAMMEAARRGADLGEFGQYMKHAGQVIGLKTTRKSDAVEAVKRGDDKAAAAALNKYFEPVFKVIGVEGDGLEFVTRRDDWQVLPFAAAEAAISLAYDNAESADMVEAWGDLVEWFNLSRLGFGGLGAAQP